MPLKRRTPLRRSTRIRPRSKTNSYRRRSRDLVFMAFIADQPCALSFYGACEGRVQVDHAGGHGLGQKCPDNETIPLCVRHHRDKTDYAGIFRGMNGARMRAWLDQEVRHYQLLFQRCHPDVASQSDGEVEVRALREVVRGDGRPGGRKRR